MRFTTLVLAAGESERFARAGITKPKGLLRMVWSKREACMLEHSAQLYAETPTRIVIKTDKLSQFFNGIVTFRVNLFCITETRGQADSAQQGVESLEGPIVVVNCDNGFSLSLDTFARNCIDKGVLAGALVFPSNRELRYGYVDDMPFFDFGAEKAAISNWALAGAFYFKDRHVLREAYKCDLAALKARGVSNAEIYLSHLFKWIPGQKLAVPIARSVLHEWGTPMELAADKTVEVTDDEWRPKDNE